MILVNNPGSWSHIYDPLEHASWHGVTPTDLVFPFFLFAVGNAMAFVIPSLKQKSESYFWKKIIKRTLLIFLIGVVLNWFPFVKYSGDSLVAKAWENVRIPGVLQRIAICYFFASVISYYTSIRWTFIITSILLLAYWYLCMIGNPSDPYSLSGWFGTKYDLAILGDSHIYHGEGRAFDPEGLMSLPAAIAEVLFGYLAGRYITEKGKNAEMLNGLFICGAAMLLTGFIWDMSFPINKKIWTSSYTVYSSGMAMIIIAVMIYFLEMKRTALTAGKFFDVFGKNALFIFVLSGALPRLLNLIRIPNGVSGEGNPKYTGPFGWFYQNVCQPLFTDPRNSSLLYAICFILLMWAIAWWLDKRRIYIKV